MNRAGMLAICTLLSACGEGASGGPIAVGDFSAAYEDAYCDGAVRCHAVPTSAECHAAVDGAALYSQLVASVAAGRIDYDGAAAAACLGGLFRLDCVQVASEIGRAHV
jgi:hypothetical protein